MCHNWLYKDRATRHHVQRLVGHLIYIRKCIPPARIFVNRILATLRRMPSCGYSKLDRSFYKNIAWFCQFLEKFNGTVKIHHANVEKHVMFVDASLKGMGAIKSKKVYAVKFPQNICEILSIVHLEAANILVALRCWMLDLQDKQCTIWCDNQAVVEVFSNNKIKDPFLMASVHTAWLICANYNIKLQVNHIRGAANVYAEILSRWDYYKYFQSAEVQYLKSCHWKNPKIQNMFPSFNICASPSLRERACPYACASVLPRCFIL